ncbi:MAG: RNA polymerase sigma factor [Microthrixaceae bacterium]
MATIHRPAAAGEPEVTESGEQFDALFLEGYPRLVRTVAFVCGDADVAADCVADAFERAYVRWRRVSRLDDPFAWVRRVALNRATDVGRRQGRGRRALERLSSRAAVDAVGHDRTAALDPSLAAAVRGLSPQQRAVVALHYLDDLSVLDVADAMGLSEGAVKYHLHQARLRLRDVLDPPGEVGP